MCWCTWIHFDGCISDDMTIYTIRNNICGYRIFLDQRMEKSSSASRGALTSFRYWYLVILYAYNKRFRIFAYSNIDLSLFHKLEQLSVDWRLSDQWLQCVYTSFVEVDPKSNFSPFLTGEMTILVHVTAHIKCRPQYRLFPCTLQV